MSTLGITTLSGLSTSAVQANQKLIAGLVQQVNPAIDAKRGTLNDILFYFSAVLGTSVQNLITTINQSNSLAAINANPALANSAVVANLLSNFNVTANPGSQAVGTVQIVLTQAVSITIPSGTQFTANGLTFITPSVFTSRLTANTVITSTDRLVTQLSNGTYVFNITLQAQVNGSSGNIPLGTRVTPVTPISAVFQQTVVLTSFTGGTDPDSNATLIAKLASGIGAKAWSNRMTADSLLRSQSNFANIVGESVIGFGDTEMIRDQHSVWPGSFGGRVDMYVRTQATLSATLVSKTAVLVGITSAGGVWQFSVLKTDAPGFYAATTIAQSGKGLTAASGYQILTDVRGYDLTNLTTPAPDIKTTAEATFTRYSTSIITFTDTDTPTVGLTVGVSARQYDVVLSYLPLLDQIQDYIGSRAVSSPAGDVLIKAPFPIICSVSLTVNYPQGSSVSIGAIQQAIATAINDLPLGTTLTASIIATAANSNIPSGAVVSGITISGVLTNEDLSTVRLSSSDMLSISYNSNHPMVSTRTVSYFITPATVFVSTAVTTNAPV